MTDQLLPCPFCGSTEIKTVVDDGIHFEQCRKCEATGPTGFKRGDEDDTDWNTRTHPAPAVVVLPERKTIPIDYGYRSGWNACLDEVAKLNNL